MNVLDSILDFFKRLLRGRYDSLRIGAKSKVQGVEYRARAAVTNKFNKAIDSTVDKAKAAVKKPAPAKPDAPKR